ncbi:MAG TPA: nucleotidyltransferase domain-containing protein [Blastocatellia bacterium]|nr:nucleotidyltransferase domain-containing protein [Blastocatellia bacterium]
MKDLIKITKQILDDRYPGADVIFLTGSLLRGEGTPYSDLDLVVIFEQLPHAWRESFNFQGYPVEAFVHDPETFNYFISELGRPSGLAAMAHMVAEGVEVPCPSEISRSVKRIAADLIAAGPPKLSDEDERKLRYTITNLIDDIRQPRSREELVASGAELYGALANYYFRANGLWSAVNKSIPRRLGKTDPELYSRFREGFEELFAGGHSDKVITLAEEILKQRGGFLFDGYKHEASPACRKPLV